uniref:Methylamine/Aralkylamine dehydrogenase light chain C-terminal domain-containing protein n=1 Tax=Thermomicrobium roseum TaxID=500 RepID=A0A7C1X1U6_THERO
MKRRSPAQQHILTTRRDWMRRLLAAFAGTVAFVTQPAPMVAQSCQDWFRCNQWGCLCSCRGGSDYSCPPGTTSSTQAWFSCCYDQVRRKLFLIRYIDCCQSTPPPACPSGCSCARGSYQPNWCGNGRHVVCTRAVLVNVC